jgi:hypothetical protein
MRRSLPRRGAMRGRHARSPCPSRVLMAASKRAQHTARYGAPRGRLSWRHHDGHAPSHGPWQRDHYHGATIRGAE